MFKKVIFVINLDVLGPLPEKCRQRGIKLFSSLTEGDDSLLVTDEPELAGRLKGKMPVLFYDPENKYAFTADYVTDDLESMDIQYLEMIYCRFYGLPLTIAVTDRTVIREMTLEDLPDLYDLYDDSFVTEYVEKLYEYEEELEFSRQYIKNMYGFYGYGLWLVFDRKTGRLAGRAGLSNRTIDNEEKVELGYVIGRNFRSKGYAYEVCCAILDYAYNQLKMEDIFICTDKNNLPSLKLAKKLCFEIYGSVIYGKTEYVILKNYTTYL